MNLFEQLEFQNPYFGIFFLIPLGAWFILLIGSRKKILIIKQLKLALHAKHAYLKWTFTTLGLLFCVIALMGPKIRIGERNINKEGLDIYVLIDTSKSMLVEDVAPSRIERSKKIIEEVLGQLSGDRVGYIPFASSAYIQMPLTDDYDLAKMFLKAIDTDMISGGGTDIGQAITLAKNSFDSSSKGDRVIVILSDGEDHNEETQKVIEKLADDHTKIFTIGVGTIDGGMIPEYSDDNSTRTGFKKDENGELILSKLDEASLKALTQQSDGQYFPMSVDDQVSHNLIQAIATLQKSTLQTKSIPEYEQEFQWFLGIGLFMLLFGLIFKGRSMSK